METALSALLCKLASALSAGTPLPPDAVSGSPDSGYDLASLEPFLQSKKASFTELNLGVWIDVLDKLIDYASVLFAPGTADHLLETIGSELAHLGQSDLISLEQIFQASMTLDYLNEQDEQGMLSWVFITLSNACVDFIEKDPAVKLAFQLYKRCDAFHKELSHEQVHADCTIHQGRLATQVRELEALKACFFSTRVSPTNMINDFNQKLTDFSLDFSKSREHRWYRFVSRLLTVISFGAYRPHPITSGQVFFNESKNLLGDIDALALPNEVPLESLSY